MVGATASVTAIKASNLRVNKAHSSINVGYYWLLCHGESVEGVFMAIYWCFTVLWHAPGYWCVSTFAGRSLFETATLHVLNSRTTTHHTRLSPFLSLYISLSFFLSRGLSFITSVFPTLSFLIYLSLVLSLYLSLSLYPALSLSIYLSRYLSFVLSLWFSLSHSLYISLSVNDPVSLFLLYYLYLFLVSSL